MEILQFVDMDYANMSRHFCCTQYFSAVPYSQHSQVSSTDVSHLS